MLSGVCQAWRHVYPDCVGACKQYEQAHTQFLAAAGAAQNLCVRSTEAWWPPSHEMCIPEAEFMWGSALTYEGAASGNQLARWWLHQGNLLLQAAESGR